MHFWMPQGLFFVRPPDPITSRIEEQTFFVSFIRSLFYQSTYSCLFFSILFIHFLSLLIINAPIISTYNLFTFTFIHTSRQYTCFLPVFRCVTTFQPYIIQTQLTTQSYFLLLFFQYAPHHPTSVALPLLCFLQCVFNFPYIYSFTFFLLFFAFLSYFFLGMTALISFLPNHSITYILI